MVLSHRYAPIRNVRAVLFDFGGTLTMATLRNPGCEQVAEHLGCDPAPLAAAMERTFAARAAGKYGDTRAALQRLVAELGICAGPDQLAAAAAARIGAIRDAMKLRDEAVTVLAALRHRGFATAVITDCTHELPEIFAALPVAPHVDAAVFSVRVGATTPHPALYLTACRELQVRPDRCLYLGTAGLAGAAQLKMHILRFAAPERSTHQHLLPVRDRSAPAITSLIDVLSLLPPHPGCHRPSGSGPNSRRVQLHDLADRHRRYRNDAVPQRWR